MCASSPATAACRSSSGRRGIGPYKEGTGPDKYSLTSIIAGTHDAYIDRWADGANDFGGPMIVSLANEMNSSWFPWVGVFYGGEKPAPGGGLPRPGDL